MEAAGVEPASAYRVWRSFYVRRSRFKCRRWELHDHAPHRPSRTSRFATPVAAPRVAKPDLSTPVGPLRASNPADGPLVFSYAASASSLLAAMLVFSRIYEVRGLGTLLRLPRTRRSRCAPRESCTNRMRFPHRENESSQRYTAASLCSSAPVPLKTRTRNPSAAAPGDDGIGGGARP